MAAVGCIAEAFPQGRKRSSAAAPDGDWARLFGAVLRLLWGYDLIREIHPGGQGVVYQAVQQSTNRKVAIKVLREGPFAGLAEKARFEREIQILGQLQHPNIVTIHDSGSASGHFYFVMDYIRGQPLDVFVANGRSTISCACSGTLAMRSTRPTSAE